ncbi:glutathione S-transferase 1-like [Calliphora vicina]|uniref:glutathione S-transferase 1-like n=1 Tax=Calliphora vicina TaxID=7373 RepID=UPI00325A88D5
MASKPILYGTLTSPTVMAVLITLKALNIEFEFREIKPRQQENLTADYLSKNPAHTVPTLETEDHKFIGDSHAIMTYLADRYANDSSHWYPRDLYRRAKVNELLHFENGVLFIMCVKQTYGPIFAGLRTHVPDEKFKEIDEAYNMMERFIGDNKYVAGQHITIADLSCITSISSMYFLRPFTEETHPKLYDWLNRMKSLPYVQEVLMSDAQGSSLKFLSKTMSHL